MNSKTNINDIRKLDNLLEKLTDALEKAEEVQAGNKQEKAIGKVFKVMYEIDIVMDRIKNRLGF